MSKTTGKSPKHFNALDVTLVLLAVLVVMGLAGRILLDRHYSSKVENRTVSYTMVLPESKAENMALGSILVTASGDKLGEIMTIDSYQSEEPAVAGSFVLMTGTVTVRGYEQKNGVFCTLDGEELRINTEISLNLGQNVHFYINDIVKNGQ